MKRVLVTGASGFIGRHSFDPLLDRGFEVHALARRPHGAGSEGVNWHYGDLLQTLCVDELLAELRPSMLLHFAWYAQPGQYWTSLENFRWVQASLQLLHSFAACGGQRVVMAGTCAEYDWRYGYCSESVTPLAPATTYGTCKHALQLMLTQFAQQRGLSAGWGRIFFVYGPFEQPSRLIPSVIRALMRGEPVRCSNGDQLRDFLHVQDVADAFVALLDGTVDGAVNIGSGQPIAVKDIVNAIYARLRGTVPIEWGAVPTPAGEPALLVGDVQRLRDEVGWQPRFDMDSGLAQTIGWWQSEIDH